MIGDSEDLDGVSAIGERGGLSEEDRLCIARMQ
jgi:hypothetical protein